MSDRPHWLPSDDEITAAFVHDSDLKTYTGKYVQVSALIERAVLEGQIEALESLDLKDNPDDDGVTCICYGEDYTIRLVALRARLAELETKP